MSSVVSGTAAQGPSVFASVFAALRRDKSLRRDRSLRSGWQFARRDAIFVSNLSLPPHPPIQKIKKSPSLPLCTLSSASLWQIPTTHNPP